MRGSPYPARMGKARVGIEVFRGSGEDCRSGRIYVEWTVVGDGKGGRNRKPDLDVAAVTAAAAAAAAVVAKPTWESRVDIDGEAEGETEDGEGDDQEDGDDDDYDDDDFIKKAFLVCLALQALQALPCFALSYLAAFAQEQATQPLVCNLNTLITFT
ncbi:hypothetical protein EYR41_005590 [Orbilia oligospora]|uniref:Uncharacterized protein n=1 Tax=Orbilia oligospora TaxID=2813651 RepID=A0A7C8PFH1_ORBOL|nr:hypothetical protein TWF751_009676 [Orbilia oligospora]TGJ69561.1 hypothetical protein EYR41_005590 [Orbilia oligospora]